MFVGEGLVNIHPNKPWRNMKKNGDNYPHSYIFGDTIMKKPYRSSLVAQRVGDLMLSLLWLWLPCGLSWIPGP